MSWDKVKISDLVEEYSVRGKDVQKSQKLEFYGVSNELGITNAKYSANDKHEDYKVIEKGCFAYNPYRINVGSIGLYDLDEKGLVSPAYVVFKTKPKSILPELLLKFLKSEEGLRQIKLYARGTVRQALRFDDLCKIELSIPDYNEQELLYDKLNSTQTKGELLINEFSYQQNLISNLRKQILQDAIQGKLVPQDPNDEPASILLENIKAEKEKLIKEKKLKKSKPLPPIKEEEIPFDIPKNWVWCRFGEPINFISGNNFLSTDFSKGKGIKCIKITNAGVEEFIETDDTLPQIFEQKYSDYLVFKDDLVLALTRPYISNGLKISLCPPSYNKSLLNQRVAVIRPFKGILNMYAYIFLRNKIVLRIYQNKFKGKGQQPNLKKDDVTQLYLPLPPQNEQKRIVDKVEELLKVCDELEKEVKQNQNLTQQLLQSALKEALEPKVN